jgi:hypothetical protein
VRKVPVYIVCKKKKTPKNPENIINKINKNNKIEKLNLASQLTGACYDFFPLEYSKNHKGGI